MSATIITIIRENFARLIVFVVISFFENDRGHSPDTIYIVISGSQEKSFFEP